jgi:hypothetical protein
MFKYILLILAAVVLYKLIFDLIIPVYRASRDIKKRFRDINQQMHERMNQSQGFNQQASNIKNPEGRPAKGQDYIDFEEVK